MRYLLCQQLLIISRMQRLNLLRIKNAQQNLIKYFRRMGCVDAIAMTQEMPKENLEAEENALNGENNRNDMKW